LECGGFRHFLSCANCQEKGKKQSGGDRRTPKKPKPVWGVLCNEISDDCSNRPERAREHGDNNASPGDSAAFALGN
jgi:hypothetical protein